MPPTQCSRYLILALTLGTGCLNAAAERIPVRHPQGTIHGFLQMRSADGQIIAAGDIVQVVHGDEVTAHSLFNFKDGSVDDETAVYSQRGAFRLITDHHVQKGPFFPHPADVLIDTRNHQVTARSIGKDGKEEVKTSHVDMPLDLANGIVSTLVANIKSGTAQTTLPMLVLTPKPRVVKLIVSPRGEEPFSVVGSARKAIHYEIKIEIGGIVGMVAPLVGKAPPNIDLWVIGGLAPTFVREKGPTYQDGPILTIELTSPVWPDSPKSSS
jgi:hypothetical protein